MNEGKKASGSFSVLHSAFKRLRVTEKVQPSNLRKSNFYVTIEQSDHKATVDSNKVESNLAGRDFSETTNKPHNLEISVKNDTDENYSLGTDCQKSRSSPVIFPKQEKRKSLPNCLDGVVIGGNEDTLTCESQPELGKVSEEEFEEGSSGIGSGMSPTGSIISDSNQRSLLTPDPSLVNETTASTMEPGLAQPPQSSECNLTFDRQWKIQASKNNQPTKQSLDTNLSCTMFENPTKTTRSLSEPITINRRSDKYFSVPNSYYATDRDKMDFYLGQANEIPEKAASNQREPTDSHSKKLKNKAKKESKTKTIGKKLMAKMNKRSSQSSSSSSLQDDEEEAQSVSSMKLPVTFQSSSPLLASRENSTLVHSGIQRTFTLRDFKFNLEPINLLEEILTGEEWARFLPARESPSQEGTSGQSPAENVCLSPDAQCLNSVIKQDISTDEEQKQLEGGSPLDSINVLHGRHGNSIIVAVPKKLITNGAIKQRISEIPQYESDSNDIYDFVEVFMLPKNNPTNKDLSLDAVQSVGILDNSALKSRIRLSKKRRHRPPKQRKAEKSKVKKSNSIFYIRRTSVDVPPHCSASTSLSPTQSVSTSASSALTSSVFYTNLPSSCDSEDPPAPVSAEEQQDTKEKIVKPK